MSEASEGRRGSGWLERWDWAVGERIENNEPRRRVNG